MKKENTPLSNEVEPLVKQLTIEQAAAEVLSRFELAVNSLDTESQDLFRLFLDGETPAELSRRKNLTEGQLREWLASIKREVIQQLRANCKVRQ